MMKIGEVCPDRKEKTMKQRVFLFHMILFAFILIPNLILAEINIFIPFHKFEIVENGKPTDVRIIATITITDYDGKLIVFWKDITIRPENNSKKTILVSDAHSTYDDSISKVKVGKDYFSFTIHTFSLAVGKMEINIVGKKKGEDRYEITGMGIWWSNILKETIKTEYRTVDKIILPYNEVY